MDKQTKQLLDKLKKNNISIETWARFEEIRHSMAIEGFEMSDDSVINSILQYEKEGGDMIFGILKARAEKEGRSYSELVREHFKRPHSTES